MSQNTTPGEVRMVPRLSDNEISGLVNQLRDIAQKYHAHQSLREHIARLIVPVLKGE